MTIYFHYGKHNISVPVSMEARQRIETISYLNQPISDPQQCIQHALNHPIGTPPLRDIAAGKRNAVILISDATRLCPSYLFLELLLGELNAGGIRDEYITIVVALGMHRKQTPRELAALVGDPVYQRVRVCNHSAFADDCVAVGNTSRGTPVEINRIVALADLLIATGNIEPHRLAGVSGGVKALVPGVASARCIEHNHSLIQRFPTAAGSSDNAVHHDMEEAAQFVPIHFLFNVIVNHQQQLMAAVAGSVTDAHRAGVKIACRHFIIPMSRTFDVVLASAGGYPKDTQLYQAAKSLVNASKLVKQGGTLLLAARCEELYGNGIFQYWAETIQDRSRILSMLQENFVLGAHKVEHIEQVLRHNKVYLYSDAPAAVVELLGMNPVVNLEQTVNELAGRTDRTVAFMPFASITFVQS